jgi:hypothetical protein
MAHESVFPIRPAASPELFSAEYIGYSAQESEGLPKSRLAEGF